MLWLLFFLVIIFAKMALSSSLYEEKMQKARKALVRLKELAPVIKELSFGDDKIGAGIIQSHFLNPSDGKLKQETLDIMSNFLIPLPDTVNFLLTAVKEESKKLSENFLAVKNFESTNRYSVHRNLVYLLTNSKFPGVLLVHRGFGSSFERKILEFPENITINPSSTFSLKYVKASAAPNGQEDFLFVREDFRAQWNQEHQEQSDKLFSDLPNENLANTFNDFQSNLNAARKQNLHKFLSLISQIPHLRHLDLPANFLEISASLHTSPDIVLFLNNNEQQADPLEEFIDGLDAKFSDDYTKIPFDTYFYYPWWFEFVQHPTLYTNVLDEHDAKLPNDFDKELVIILAHPDRMRQVQLDPKYALYKAYEIAGEDRKLYVYHMTVWLNARYPGLELDNWWPAGTGRALTPTMTRSYRRSLTTSPSNAHFRKIIYATVGLAAFLIATLIIAFIIIRRRKAKKSQSEIEPQ